MGDFDKNGVPTGGEKLKKDKKKKRKQKKKERSFALFNQFSHLPSTF
jgi:hypothetical protein